MNLLDWRTGLFVGARPLEQGGAAEEIHLAKRMIGVRAKVRVVPAR